MEGQSDHDDRPEARKTAYRLVIAVPGRDDDRQGVRRLRAVLKALGRSYGVRCISVVPETGDGEPAPSF